MSLDPDLISRWRVQLWANIQEMCISHGEFDLSRGGVSDIYIDLRQVTLRGAPAALVGALMLDLVSGWDFDMVGGLTMGADPVATAMMHQAQSAGRHLDACVVRQADKAHGLQRRIEGPDVAGRRVLVVEDTSTTGRSPLEAADVLTDAGATVVGVAVVVDRGGGVAIKERRLPFLPLYILAGRLP